MSLYTDTRLISRGSIIPKSAVEYLDITLPTGYDHFILRMTGVQLDTPDTLLAAFSDNGGRTFISDQDNYDTYRMQGIDAQGSSVTGDIGSDAGLWFTNAGAGSIMTSGGQRAIFDMMIYPGSSVASPATVCHAYIPNDDGATMISTVASNFNINAETPVSPRRVNLMRIVPFGNQDFAPPTSHEKITSAAYFLYGVPAP